MKALKCKLSVLLMGAAACLIINGCFSCSYRSQQSNPYPSSSGTSSSSTTVQGSVP